MPSSDWALALADAVLTVLHIAIVVGFCVLWIPRSTVRLHRWLVGLTAVSWIGLGLVHGFGYCLLTDVHWQIKRARGVEDLPGSFLKYAADWVTGSSIPPATVDTVAGVVFILGCFAAAWRWQQLRG